MPLSAKTTKAAAQILVHETLGRLADKWTLLVIDALSSGGEMRFTHLLKKVEGISQKMLTKTLRELESDGLVSRHVHPVVPPRVEYKLTPLGESLDEAVCTVWKWVAAHAAEIERSRRAHARGR